MSYLSLAKEIIQRNEIKTEATLDNALQNTGERPLQINV